MQEKSDRPTALFAHLVGADIRVIDRAVAAPRKGDAEQSPGGVERSGDDVVEHEVWLYLGFVDFVPGLPYLLRVVAPVPGRDRLVEPIAERGFGEIIKLLGGFKDGRRPDLPQQIFRSFGCLRHRVVEAVGGVCLVAKEPRLFGAQRQHLADQRPVVVRARVLAARDPRLVGGATQVAARREGQEWLDRGARQRDRVFAVEPALTRGFRRGGASEIGQSFKIALAEHEAPFVLIVQYVLAEQRVQCCQAFGDLLHPRLLRGVEHGAVAHEAQVIALEQPQLIGRKVQLVAVPMERVDAGEQGGVERNSHEMRGEFGRVIAVDRVECVVGRTGGQVVKDAADPVEQPAAALHRFHGIGDTGRLVRSSNGGNLGVVLFHAAVESGRKMLRPDRRERRQLERRVPGLEKGVVGHALQIGWREPVSTIVPAKAAPLPSGDNLPVGGSSIRIDG